MKSGAKCLTSPRWQQLQKRYKHDYLGFAVRYFGVDVTLHQVLITKHVQNDSCRVSISSGHGTGKSFYLAVIVLVFLMLNDDARIVLVANKVQQVKISLFKYIKGHWAELQKRAPWLSRYFVLTETSFYALGAKGQWEVVIKGFRLGQEESLAGEHAEHLMYIVDEASGISDKAFNVIIGALTQGDNRIVLISQPTRGNGYFYDTHHSLKKENNGKISDVGKYDAIKLNAEESPLVTKEWLIGQFVRYGCDRDNAEYKIKVRGEFPEQTEGFLLSEKQCQQAIKARVRHYRDWGWVAIVDVGDGRDRCVINIMRVSGYRNDRRVTPYLVLEFPPEIEALELVDEVKKHCKDSVYPAITIGIDANGTGKTVAKMLERDGLNVQRIRWGTPMHSKQDKEDYFNQRAFCTVMARDAVKQGRMRIDPHKKTTLQATKIPYFMNETGQIQIMKKKEMKDKLKIDSPDRWDTYCMVFLANVIPAMEATATRNAERLAEIQELLD